MFPLKEKKVIRGCKAHINASLGCATDYVADYVELYSPCDGTVETYKGTQGGNWLRLITDDYKIEFAHLSQYVVKSGKVKEGQLLAITGNTGSITTGPHLHVQIFKDGRRIDPETFMWDTVDMTDQEKLKYQITIDSLKQDKLNLENMLKDKDSQWQKEIELRHKAEESVLDFQGQSTFNYNAWQRSIEDYHKAQNELNTCMQSGVDSLSLLNKIKALFM